MGRVLGGVWGVLGTPWAVFWRLFLMLTFGMLSGRALAAFWGRFWLDFESPKGSRRGPREAQEGVFGRSWRSFCLIFSLSFFTSIFPRFFIDFGWVWGGFGRPKWRSKSILERFF